MSAVPQRNTVNATGRSGKTYTFTEYPIGTEFKSLGAVYMFLNGRATVYVGQTEDLSERFDDHHKADCIRRHGATVICVLVVSGEAERLAIERDLLANYPWPCNG